MQTLESQHIIITSGSERDLWIFVTQSFSYMNKMKTKHVLLRKSFDKAFAEWFPTLTRNGDWLD